MKIVTVVGARPQFVKAAAVSREIAKHPDITEVIVHTGQHFDANMSDVFFDEMQISRPHYFLDINSVGHGAMTGRMLEKIEELLLVEKPDYVLVYGDTNSTLAGALAAKKIHIKVIHVEAGLRSFNMAMPEEINRILTDRISDILCCPTDQSVSNLLDEGFARDAGAHASAAPAIVKTGDVMEDAALFYSNYSTERSRICADLHLKSGGFAVCTIHRAENTDDPARLRGIVGALLEIAQKIPLVLPLHPRTRKMLESAGVAMESLAPGMHVVPPVGYFDMIELLKNCNIVITDSGGLQKEAFFFRKPCLTLREETEWVELVDAGVNELAGSDSARILRSFDSLNSRELDFSGNLYGGGNASANIIDAIVSHHGSCR